MKRSHRQRQAAKRPPLFLMPKRGQGSGKKPHHMRDSSRRRGGNRETEDRVGAGSGDETPAAAAIFRGAGTKIVRGGCSGVLLLGRKSNAPGCALSAAVGLCPWCGREAGPVERPPLRARDGQ